MITPASATGRIAPDVERARDVSTDHLLRILKPTTTSVRRQRAGRATMGDSAEAVVGPGMLDLLTSPVAGGSMPLGAGILPETIAGLSIAATAAYLALGDEERKHHPFNWAGGELELTWKRAARRGETLVGRARLREMHRFTLDVDVETCSATTGDVLMTGEIRFVGIRDGRAVRLRDSLLAFEQPALEAARERLLVQPARRGGRALRSLCGALRRLCAGSRGAGKSA